MQTAGRWREIFESDKRSVKYRSRELHLASCTQNSNNADKITKITTWIWFLCGVNIVNTVKIRGEALMPALNRLKVGTRVALPG